MKRRRSSDGSQTPLPLEAVKAITTAYQALAPGMPVPVAVRSFAAAEDLPDASFAEQQRLWMQFPHITRVAHVSPLVIGCPILSLQKGNGLNP
jgi:hypothetical protein